MNDFPLRRSFPVPASAAASAGATALPEVATPSSAPTPAPRVLARASLLAAVVTTSTTGCLITDPPQFTTQQHTAPFLVPSSASPDARSVVILDIRNLGTETFSAEVISQDDPAGSTGQFQQVQSRLYIDYGFTPGPGQPFRYVLPGTTLDPGTIDQTTGRRVSASWFADSPPVDLGCHTVTLVASHIFDAVPECPACNDDFSTITWQVLSCDSSSSTNGCASLPLTTAGTGCPPLDNSCEQVAAESDAGSSCPEATDGGTP
jgi:hypothetical protein